MAAAHSAAQRSGYSLPPPPSPYNDDLRLPSIKDLHFPYPNRHRQEPPQASDNPPPPAYDPSPSPVHERSARHSQTWNRPPHHAAHPPVAPPSSNHVHQPHPQHHAPPSSPGHEAPLRHQEYAPRHENDGYATPGIPLSAQTTPIPGSVISGPGMRGDEYHQHASSKRLRANNRTPVIRDSRNSSGTYSYSSYSTGIPPPSPYHQTSPVSAVHPPTHPGQHSSPPSTEGSSQQQHPTYATYQTPYVPPSRPANTGQSAPVSSVQHSAPPPPPPSHHTPHSAPYPSPTHASSHWEPPSGQQPPTQPPVPPVPQQSHNHPPQHYHHPPPVPTAPTPAPPASHHAPPPQYSQHMHPLPPPPPPHAPTHSHSHPPPPPPPEPPSYQQPVHVQQQPAPQQINQRTTAINPAQLDARGSYIPGNPSVSTTAHERSFAPDPTMVELADLCSSLYDFASRYAQLHGAMPHVVPQSQEIVAMSAHAHNVVRLLEELRRESMDDEHIKNDSDSASVDDHRPPKRPWEDMAQDGHVEGDSSINYDEYDDVSVPGQSTAEQDMELIRTKRATTTAGASSNTSQPKSKYRKRSRATPPGRCHSCNIRETPEWRRGPDGARTLCNACGLHYAKLMRKQNKMNPGPNGEPPPPIDMEMLRASTRAAEAEKSNRSKTEEIVSSTAMAHHQGFFQVMTPSIQEQVPASSPTAESSHISEQQQPIPPPPTSSGTNSSLPPPPWSATPSLGRTYAPEQVQQSFVRSSIQDPSSR
ncbi:gata-type sexual development transcription factor [Moniliophthora roreri]|uniref:GATA-type domain-containing protein n=1 Tax=Moniliophthora roreri TaxID=221103 RepID=A0A0W0F1S7_MONRR|nr:gata-type sexual development transcription factor [Moniliophthora roreri]